jgi:hypothetical protein
VDMKPDVVVLPGDPDWPDWYAAHMVAERAGTELPI